MRRPFALLIMRLYLQSQDARPCDYIVRRLVFWLAILLIDAMRRGLRRIASPIRQRGYKSIRRYLPIVTRSTRSMSGVHCMFALSYLLCVAACALNKARLVKIWICLRQFLRQRVEHIFQTCCDALAVLADVILRKPIGQYLKMFPSHNISLFCVWLWRYCLAITETASRASRFDYCYSMASMCASYAALLS